MTGRALVVQGDALHLPLPDGSVDLIVASPPYWALRAYNAGQAEIGSEPTPAAYLAALWAATAEMARVLKPTGSIFVDLGDKYAGGGMGGHFGLQEGKYPEYGRAQADGYRRVRTDTPAKSLMLLPERYRVGCVDQLGLIARAVIVWDKPNGLPESVTDRVRRSHEDWVHLVKQPRYYSATDEIREPHTMRPQRRPNGRPEDLTPRQGQPRQAWSTAYRDEVGIDGHPLGKLPGSVWTIPSEPLRLPDHLGVQHYAAFPSEWPRRLILGFSAPGICLDCGQGRAPVVERERPADQTDRIRKLAASQVDRATMDGGTRSTTMGIPASDISTRILGYACICSPRQRREDGTWRTIPFGTEGYGDGPPTRPSVVLDPFGGTGTVPMVARALDRIGISVDLSAPYCRAARWRIHNNAGKAISRTNLERQGSLL